MVELLTRIAHVLPLSFDAEALDTGGMPQSGISNHAVHRTGSHITRFSSIFMEHLTADVKISQIGGQR